MEAPAPKPSSDTRTGPTTIGRLRTGRFRLGMIREGRHYDHGLLRHRWIRDCANGVDRRDTFLHIET